MYYIIISITVIIIIISIPIVWLSDVYAATQRLYIVNNEKDKG